MLVQKLFEPLKLQDDTSTNDYLDISYSVFSKEIISPAYIKKLAKKLDVKIISNLIRFFRMINPSVKLDEEIFKDIFKNKPNSLSNFSEKVIEIYRSQNSRLLFTEKINFLKTSNFFCKDNTLQSLNNSSNNIRELCNITWKINLIISNKSSNRVLLPEIIITYYFTSGESKIISVSMKVFQEMRKALTFHIKRIIDNEKINLLNNK